MKARVLYNENSAGVLEKNNAGYLFNYDKDYLQNDSLPAISLSLPKRDEAYKSETLFSFFYGLLAEGDNKLIQCQKLKIDEDDHFTRLIKTARENTIGAITIREIEE